MHGKSGGGVSDTFGDLSVGGVAKFVPASFKRGKVEIINGKSKEVSL